MKKIFILTLILLLVLSSCDTTSQDPTNNEQQFSPNKVAEYHITTVQISCGKETGPIVELQGELPVFEYEGEDIQYARYITDLNRILSQESESWIELANEILGASQEMCSKDSLLSTFEVNVSCKISTENGYPAVTFNVREVRGLG